MTVIFFLIVMAEINQLSMVTRVVSSIEPYVFALIDILIHLKATKNGTSAKRRFYFVYVFFFHSDRHCAYATLCVCRTSPVTALQKLYNVYIFLLEREFFFHPE